MMRIERWLHTAWLALRSLFRHQAVERELDEELQYHVEQRVHMILRVAFRRQRLAERHFLPLVELSCKRRSAGTCDPSIS